MNYKIHKAPQINIDEINKHLNGFKLLCNTSKNNV